MVVKLLTVSAAFRACDKRPTSKCTATAAMSLSSLTNGKSFFGPCSTEPGAGHFGQRNLLIALPKAHSCLSKNTPHDGLLDLLCLHHIWFRSHSCHVLNPINIDKPRLPQHLQSLFMLTSRNLRAKRHSVAGKVHIMAESCWAHMLLGQDLQPWATQLQG